MAIRKLKTPTNYLMKDLPDFDKISHLYFLLNRRPITLSEVRTYQDIWNQAEPDPPAEQRKQLL